ncbi:methyl-accepting chemotaxis (MCP) signaling domain protein, partial [Vibrio parahaemolyticus V-223/04]
WFNVLSLHPKKAEMS